MYVYICMYRKIKRSKLSFPPLPPLPGDGVGVADTLDTIIEKGVKGLPWSYRLARQMDEKLPTGRSFGDLEKRVLP